MKVIINAGHTKNGAGSGAVGLLNESEETRNIIRYVSSLLKTKGHTVINATVDKASSQTEYLKQVVKKANNSGGDLFILIHLNSGGGKGCEAYTWKGEKVKQAVNVCEELHNLGFVNRGVKDGSGLYVIKHTTMTAILIEVCFVDGQLDYDLYKKLGVFRVAQAIVKGLVK
jgi:N-acetylmuramoyl-L-alanine amidase